MGFENKKHTKETRKKISMAVAGENNPMFGKRHTQNSRSLMSKIQKGVRIKEKNTNWKGGKYFRKDGYIAVRTDEIKNDRTVYALEHRVVMEKYLGRKLERTELVHHLDGNRTNNDLSNLEIRSLKEHSALGYTSGYNQGFIDCALNILAHVV